MTSKSSTVNNCHSISFLGPAVRPAIY